MISSSWIPRRPVFRAGPGTFVFLVGIGRPVEGGFKLSQFFMRNPSEETGHAGGARSRRWAS